MGFRIRQPHDKQKHILTEIQSAFGYLRRQIWTAPDAAVADSILDGQATSNSVITTVTTFDSQPDFPRKVIVTPGGTTNDVPAGNVVVTGTNIRDEVITENLAFLANATNPTTSTKAFKTITSIVFPVQDGASATYDVGITDALGLDRCMAGNEVLLATADGVYETTRPTVTFHATDVSKNTVDLNTALDAGVDVTVVYVSTEKTQHNNTTA